MSEEKSPARDMKNTYNTLLLVLADALLVGVASGLALLLRFEFAFDELILSGYFHTALSALPAQAILICVLLWILKGYSSLWQFAGTREFLRVILACVLGVALELAVRALLSLDLPRSYPALFGIFLLAFLCGDRLVYRLLWQRTNGSRGERRRTMLIGAGDAGALFLREFQTSAHSENRVVCIIDDDPSKRGRDIRGVPIVGTRKDIPEAVQRYDVSEIIFAIPSASPSARREIAALCQQTGCELKTLPSLFQLVKDEVSIQKVRRLRIEDLLGRDSVQVDMGGIGAFIAGKTVLVTGGGGSIGSELCRQIAAMKPGLLIIFDIYENNAYDIQQELKRSLPQLPMEVLIGSVRDEVRLAQVFEQYHPQLIYHAAAHKHVPLMEDSPMEAIKNNVFGTLNVARMADRYGVEKMVLISTDKAVNPTNIMGASKRICEMVVEMVGRHSQTAYVAVRFGNVLGSNGSVIPLFQKQIAEGGPVTVTDKRIIRYFMTIPEAVSLVLQAGVYAATGEIFILDMGEPVKIDDLARNMIRLSGFEPDVEIPIVYTGLRPGEKLYEELLLATEGMRKTQNDLIYIAQDVAFEDEELQSGLDRLKEAAESGDKDAVRAAIHSVVPEFREPLETASVG